MTVERKSAPPMYQRRCLIGAFLLTVAATGDSRMLCPHFYPKNFGQCLAVNFPATCFRYLARVEHCFVTRQTGIQIFRRFVRAEYEFFKGVDGVWRAVRRRPFPPQILSVSSLPSFRALFRRGRFLVHHFAERDRSAASGFADVGGFHKGDDLQRLFRLNRRSLRLEEFYDGGDPAVIAGTRRLIPVRSLRLFAGVL